MRTSEEAVRRERDYKREYQRRLERGLGRSLSRSQARGHARAGEASITGRLSLAERKLQQAVSDVRGGYTTERAARLNEVSTERLRRELDRIGGEKRRGRWVVANDKRGFDVPLYTRGQRLKLKVNYTEAAKAGGFMSAVGSALTKNDPAWLKPFEGKGVFDLAGRFYVFETHINVLRRLDSSGPKPWEEHYKAHGELA